MEIGIVYLHLGNDLLGLAWGPGGVSVGLSNSQGDTVWEIFGNWTEVFVFIVILSIIVYFARMAIRKRRLKKKQRIQSGKP
jgi:membrane protein implicated in regulation of membrane protease activity